MTSISNRDWLMRLAHDAPDELAAWMDAEHGEPPEGDAVKLMREHSLYEIGAILHPAGGGGCTLSELADMVERDYVSREVFEDLRDEFTWETTFLHRMGKQCGTKDVPSLVAYVDKLEARVEELEAVDRRIAETDSRWEAATRDLERMTAERDELKRQLDTMRDVAREFRDERDEWKAKAEGSSKVRAGSSSAKRAAAVERLKDVRYHTLADYVRAMLGWGHEPHFEDCRDALIDLLTDESCGQDADKGIRAEAPVRESCTNLDELHDSRKKLEADAMDFCERFYTTERRYNELIKLLDLQAAITEREVKLRELYKFEENHRGHIRSIEEVNQKLNERIAELQSELAKRDKRIAELEADLRRSYDAESAKAEELTLRGVRIAELQEQVDKLTAERDGWRMRCGDLLDAAHAMQGVADAWDEEV